MDRRNKAVDYWVDIFHPSLKHGLKFVDSHGSKSEHLLLLDTSLVFLEFLPKERADLVDAGAV